MKLYPYQTEGVAWLTEPDREHALLHDEQGLGKTIQAIKAADELGSQCVLVVCPSVVLWNWAREIERWSARPRVIELVETGKTEIGWSYEPMTVVVSHGLLLRPYIRAQLLAREWDLLIVDEAHMFRNPEALRTVALHGGDKGAGGLVGTADRVIAMTGTPMPNDASELWASLHGLFPDRITKKGQSKPFSYERFKAAFCEIKPTPYGEKVVGIQNAHELKAILADVALRRKVDDVLKDMPPLRYETIALRPREMPHEIERLQAVLSAPVVELLDKIETIDEGFSALRSLTEFSTFRHWCGLLKIDPVVELIRMELECGALNKIVVFAHHAAVVKGIADGLEHDCVTIITGATSTKDRQTAVDIFQNDPTVSVMVCNIIAGGVGITLTAAHEVMMVEQSFVPGDNDQAVKRVRRIGQTKPVRVRCVSLAGTLDDLVTDAITLKTQMISEVL